jgi:DNA polymerase III epsilon subunit-like protein
LFSILGKIDSKQGGVSIVQKNKMNNQNRILIFDVETTGLLPKDQVSNIALYPHIIQFSFILYNLETRAIERKHNFYINVLVDVPKKITEITGITKQMCDERGIHILMALDCFYECYTMAGCVIAHNLTFDATMIRVELDRNRAEIDLKAHYCFNIFDAEFEKSHRIEQFCTMRYGTNICNIMKAKENIGSNDQSKITYYKKWPTLLEFHKHLFDTIPENLHNSIVDVLVCMRCYLKSYRKIEIAELEFSNMMKMCV